MNSQDNYVRRFRLLRVVDADSLHATVDMGYRRYSDEAIRLLDVDAPEINRGTVEEKAKGQEAKAFTIAWFRNHHMHRAHQTWPFWVASAKSDDFARWLGDVFCECGAHLSEDLIAAGHDTGRRWAGNTVHVVEGGGA